MTIFLLTSSDREHGGTVIHGVFSTKENAMNAISQIEDVDYWRIPFIQELEVDDFIN